MKAFTLTGYRGQGKTTAVLDMAHMLKASRIGVSGVAAPAVFALNGRIGYDIIDLATETRVPWLRLHHGSEDPDIGPFSMQRDGVAIARRALLRGLKAFSGILFIDEIGPLELRNGGHAWFLEKFNECTADTVVMTARPWVAAEINIRWTIGSIIHTLEECDSIRGRLGIQRG